MLFKPTSIKAMIARNVVAITHEHVINCAPLTPTFLPKNPETIDPNKGKIIMTKYIIYILLQYFLFVFPLYLRNIIYFLRLARVFP
jgi:hypothetical protein